MNGVSRRLLESAAPEKQFDVLLNELIFLSRSYLNACSKRSRLRGLEAPRRRGRPPHN
jgi:hypothetical protein